MQLGTEPSQQEEGRGRKLLPLTYEVRRGAQGASLVAPRKSGLHAHGEVYRVIAIESW